MIFLTTRHPKCDLMIPRSISPIVNSFPILTIKNFFLYPISVTLHRHFLPLLNILSFYLSSLGRALQRYPPSPKSPQL